MPRWTSEQQLAIDMSGTNIIVSAGAGSGKTAVLTTRIGRILSEGNHINELLVLTFTKAAASEMKERVRKFIKKDESLKGELDLIDSSYITTFDSFALSVVKKYHYLLNISSNIKITDGSLIEIVKDQVLREVLDNFYTDDDYLRLVSEFCNKSDSNLFSALRGIIDEVLKSDEVDVTLDRIISAYNEDGINTLFSSYESLVFKKLEELKLVVDGFSHYVESDFYSKVLSSFSALFNSNCFSDILVNINVDIPRMPKGSDEETKYYKDKVLKVKLDEVKALLSYGSKEEIINNLVSSRSNVLVFVKIVREFFKVFNEYKLVNEIYDFQDIALLAIKIVREFPSACLELKNTFKEIMIDEYQDTNNIQETFISYIANDNVYCVGDIKQSIYRFRNANPYIFKSKYDNYSNNLGGRKIDLLKNFRSRSEVLDDINLIFCAVMNDTIGGADYVATHQMVFGNNTYIEEGKTDYNYNLRVLNYGDVEGYSKTEIEMFTIANDIKSKIDSKYQVFDKDELVLRDATYNDFVIIMDRVTEFRNYKKVFDYLNIPLTIIQDDTLTGSVELYLLKNSLILVNEIANKRYDTKFKHAFISIARSYLYQMSDSDILSIFKSNKFYDTVIYKDFLSISESIGVMNLKMVLRSIIDTTKYYEKIYLTDDVVGSEIRLSKLIDLIDGFADCGNTIDGLIDYLDKIIENGLELKYNPGVNSGDSVKIINIHKSKGLEYHICYFSGLFKTFNISDVYQSMMFYNKFGLIMPVFNSEYGIEETILKTLVRDDYMNEEISEKIRLFYVALTRAKEQMIILLPRNDNVVDNSKVDGVINDMVRSKYNSLMSIMYSVESILKKYYESVDIASIGLCKDYLYGSKSDDDLLLGDSSLIVDELVIEPKYEESISYSKSINKRISVNEYELMEFGTKVHEILEYIDFNNVDESLIDDDFIKGKVLKFIDSDLLSNVSSGVIYKEFEFVNNSSHGIIDLLIEYDDHIDIIDYKLKNIDDINYDKQLNGYRSYIASRTGKVVKCYLYSILNEVYREVME